MRHSSLKMTVLTNINPGNANRFK